jgi:hypothetical protein
LGQVEHKAPHPQAGADVLVDGLDFHHGNLIGQSAHGAWRGEAKQGVALAGSVVAPPNAPASVAQNTGNTCGSKYIPPCIPTRAAKPPSGPDWVHEVKHDGYRLQVRREGPAVRLFTHVLSSGVAGTMAANGSGLQTSYCTVSSPSPTSPTSCASAGCASDPLSSTSRSALGHG